MRKGRTVEVGDRNSITKANRMRCAIYTRKSTEEGLDQAFNSLDAQREACAAYILSQRHEGWVAVPDLYDDGGYSGGTMERPALKRLLSDVEAGRIDVIVGYKVDRLTRALSDFAKIVDVLDGKSVSFVSITQSFNTTTSMGRLTLNVLLSFAQFEREVISERVRDKVAASKKKGMWMGGNVPLGYDAIDRKLVINPAEAQTVRHIFERYLELGAVDALVSDLADAAIRTKTCVQKNGTTRGGRHFERGGLYHLLANPIYVGKIKHKGQVFDGEHEAIIADELWEQVQAQLIANAVRRRHGTVHNNPALLAGMISDTDGRRMTPSHAARGSVRYLYYVSVNQTDGQEDAQGRNHASRDGLAHPNPILRLPAQDIETAVIRTLVDFLNDQHAIFDHLPNDLTADQMHAAALTASEIAKRLEKGEDAQLEQRAFCRALVVQVVAGSGNISVSLSKDGLSHQLRLNHSDAQTDSETIENQKGCDGGDRIRLPIIKMAQCATQGRRVIIAPHANQAKRRPDPKLLALIARARQARAQLMGDIDLSGVPLECSPKYLARTAQLGYLAPTIVKAIIEGRQPPTLTARTLSRVNQLPLRWADQEKLLGIV